MVLTRSLVRMAAARPAALLAVSAGATAVRLAVERELRRRAWPVAAAPAHAALLLLCGRPDAGMSAAAERVWRQLPPPKAWVQVGSPAQAAGALDRARQAVADYPATREQRANGGGDEGHEGHAGNGAESLPGGLAMAERAPDRDGLALDQLHVALGPVLLDWPAGLVLHLAIQGDVVQHARFECLEPTGGEAAYWQLPWGRAAAGEPVPAGEAARWLLARQLDSASRLLAVAGWDGAAATGRRLRDEALGDGALGGAPGADLARRYQRFAGRVAGSWLLRWMTRGLGRIDAGGAAAFGFTPPPAGTNDVYDRLRWWLDRGGRAADRLADDRPLADLLGTGDVLARPPQGGVAGGWALAQLSQWLTGTELAAARLLVASLDPDLDRLPVPIGGRGG